MEKLGINPASLLKRIVAFFIDLFVVYVLRFVYVTLCMRLWLINSLIAFMTKYQILFGNFDKTKITSAEINFFFESQFFKSILVFIGGIFLVSFLYNFIILSTKWSASVGQKIMNLKVIKNSGENIGFINSFFRSFFIIIPWLMCIFIFINEILAYNNFSKNIDKASFVIFIFIFASWYDFVFFTKNKLTFHDFLSRTVVVETNNEKLKTKDYIKGFLFPNFSKINSKMLATIKNMFGKLKNLRK